jgi:histone acetyltransferase (RNA polymerase elongator complex component)
VECILARAVRSPGFVAAASPEIAFYGGTFTGLPEQTLRELLEAAYRFVQNGKFESIRVSTRPDALNPEVLSLMRSHGVALVELGVQSMDEEVLRKTQRGYTPKQVEEAVDRLRRHGFRVGAQLMPGLPGDSEERFFETIRRVTALRPALVRLYPTVVIRGTALAAWYRDGRYRPLSLDRAVALCARSCAYLEARGIPVIRMGLQGSPTLERPGEILAGPWHPAFGFLVRNRLYQERLERLLAGAERAKSVRIRVHPRDVPLVRGHRNRSLRELEHRVRAGCVEIIPDRTLVPGRPVVECWNGNDPVTGGECAEGEAE